VAGIPRTLSEIIRKATNGALADVHVALPAKVLSYSATTNLADVDVQVQHSVWDDDNRRTYEDPGTLPGVPVMWPRAGGFLLTLPLTAGDTGLLVFNSDAIGEWRSTNQKSKPADSSRLSVGWPVFIPGLFADMNPFAAGDVPYRTAGVVLGKDGGSTQIQINSSTIDVGVGATFFAAYGDVNDLDWTAAKTLSTAIATFATALTTYANAIKAIADPPGTATAALAAANGVLAAASTAFNAAVQPTKASIARVK
jgi:hypothetical protein